MAGQASPQAEAVKTDWLVTSPSGTTTVLFSIPSLAQLPRCGLWTQGVLIDCGCFTHRVRRRW